MSGRLECRIYIGNLPPDVREDELQSLFEKYGKINYIDIKDGRSSSYAFIEFDNVRDADDAIYHRDGYDLGGFKIRVEFCRGGRGNRNRDNSPGRSRYGGRYGRRRIGPPSRRTEYRVLISNLPPTGSWQDLKDHMREAGDVCYADVYKDGNGVVEFVCYEGMKYALKHLNETKFRSHEGHTSYIRVKRDTSARISYSRSRTPSLSGRRSKSPGRDSPSYSPMDASRSRSASKAHSPTPNE